MSSMSSLRRPAIQVLASPAAVALALAVAVWLPAPQARAIGAWVDEQPGPALLEPRDRVWYRQAFRAADKGAWASAFSHARNAKEKLPEKALRWAYYRRTGNRASFAEIAAFLEANRHWPRLTPVRKRAEEAMRRDVEDATVLAWFAETPPVSGPGRIRLAETLFRVGRDDEAMEWLRLAWVQNTFTKRQAQGIYRRHKRRLTQADHAARLDRLLWDAHRYSARRMLSLVPKDQRRLADARLTLMTFGPAVDAKIAAVPRDVRSDPGLVYERVRWRRRKGLHNGAQQLLLSPPPEQGLRPDKWWIERRIQARQLLRDGRWPQAYELAAAHGLEPGGERYAQAEFLAGWVALRFGSEPRRAYRHFRALYDAVTYPVSLARAAYWAGRAAEAAGDADLASRWLTVATNYATTYYGQLALARQHAGKRWTIPGDAKPRANEVEAFNQDELVRLVRMLDEIGADDDWLKPFVLQLSVNAETPGEHVLVTRLAASLQRPDLMVRTAKGALRRGVAVYTRAYPLIELESSLVEPALVMAVARQESEFNPDAVSHAGARGLMQLMPATARKVAKQEGLRYHKRRLTDPAYNLRLGTAYLDDLIDAYDGSYIMALAAYNAGPGRVKRWVRDYGDPRRDDIDVIDWVESIPITETRNYVQRVMENLQVYRARLAQGPVRQALLNDLRRAGRGL